MQSGLIRLIDPAMVARSTTLLVYIFIGCRLFGQQPPPWVAPKDAQSIKNPLVSSPQALAEAKTLYTANCGPCHGEKGKGDGPAAQGLNPKPADHTSAIVQNESDGSLFWKLSEGHNPMPAYNKVFTDQQRWELILYIRSLARSGKKK
ncbi:MAG: cytochrome c [Bacteroidetes bacterium]|nr:cytochrome c [Bacteroidota bacterium]